MGDEPEAIDYIDQFSCARGYKEMLALAYVVALVTSVLPEYREC